MSGKFFSLIHSGENIHIAPETDILPSEAFSSLLSAEELLAKVQDDITTFKKGVAEECEIVKEQAYKEGFEEGYAVWTQHVAALEKEISRVHEEVRKLIVPLALKAAKKIVGRELEVSKDVTVDIVANSLKAVAQHKKIIVYVNKQDVEALEASKSRLRGLFEQLESLSIRERADIERGGCIIETEAGIINARLPNQWLILEQAFASLMQSSGEEKHG